jgi:hypothetical protein
MHAHLVSPFLLLLVALPGFLLSPLLSLLSGPIAGTLQAALYQLFKKSLTPAMDRWPSWLNQAANAFIALLVTYLTTQKSIGIPADVTGCLSDPGVLVKANCAVGLIGFAVQFIMTWVTAHITHSGIRTAALKRAGKLPA